MDGRHRYDCRCEDCVSYADGASSAERQQVIDWRLGELLALGLAVETAERLAQARDAFGGWAVDLEDARRLIARDCPAELVGRILAPA